MQINIEQEMRVMVSKLIPRFEMCCAQKANTYCGYLRMK